MSQLLREEIEAGLVSHLDQTMLSNDQAVLDTYPQARTELRPFVCLKADANNCVWAPLSSTFRRERLQINDEWRQGGVDMWRERECYLNDGANTYHGPIESFIAASAQELTEPINRSRMAAEGVAAVIKETERQRKRRINGKDV